jgi:hypothetical protein
MTSSQHLEGNQQNPEEKISAEVKSLINKAEEMRFAKSKQYTQRQKLFVSALSFLAIGSSSNLVWALLMGGDIYLALGGIVVAIIIPLLLAGWAKSPTKEYRKNFKTEFMPALAKAIGNLDYFPTGGIAMKSMKPSGIIPPHATYTAEDGFRGKFKNNSLTISEGRLYSDKKNAEPIFNGVLVMITTPKGKFKGHTIITSDHEAIKKWANTRWKKFNSVQPREGIAAGDYKIYANNVEEAQALADEDYMELLQRLSELFSNSLISSAFYAGNRVLLLIPSDEDMFEPGDIDMPVSSQGYALKCKREIEQILHVVDVIDVYEPDSAAPPQQQPVPEQPPVQQQQPPAAPPQQQPVAEQPPVQQQQQPPAAPPQQQAVPEQPPAQPQQQPPAAPPQQQPVPEQPPAQQQQPPAAPPQQQPVPEQPPAQQQQQPPAAPPQQQPVPEQPPAQQQQQPPAAPPQQQPVPEQPPAQQQQPPSQENNKTDGSAS